MNGKTSKLVNSDRVIELLECYGANADGWPDDERTAAIALIRNSTELQHRQLDAQKLDDVMDVYNVRQSIHTRAKMEVVNRIVGQLPEQTRQNIKPINHRPATHAKRQTKAWQKYGMAAALAAVLITALVVIEQPSPTQPQLATNASQNVVDQWMWQEIYGTTPPQGETEEPLTFMALVDMESLPSDE
jgi:hypothetical protein